MTAVTLNANHHYVIIRVHSGFSLVENCDLSEDRCTLTPFQRQANHSNFRIKTYFVCIDHDHVKWRAKVFSSHYKAYFRKKILYKKVDNILRLFSYRYTVDVIMW